MSDVNIDTSVLKEALLGKSDIRIIVPIFQEHNNRVKSFIGIDFVKGTHQKYVAT